MIVKDGEIEKIKLDDKSSRKILSYDDELMMVKVFFKKDGIGEVHSHEEHEQVSYIVKGSFKVTVGDKEEILKEGDSFYAAKNVKHGIVALEDSEILDVFTPPRAEFLE